VSNTTSVLSNSVVREAFKQRGLDNVFVEVFDSLPSTSEYLAAIAKQATAENDVMPADKAPQICIADWQTNGNGRRGKTWVTDRGNVTFSMLLSMRKPPSELLGLSLVTGICVAECLVDLTNLPVQLKWPNDVLVADGKLCGLLTELVSTSQGVTQVVIGVGINYKQPASIEGSDYEPVNLPGLITHAPKREEIISDLSVRLLEGYALFAEHGWSEFADRWNKFDYLIGRQVKVINAGVEEYATAVGVDSSGALLIEHNGKTDVVYSGDVSVRLA